MVLIKNILILCEQQKLISLKQICALYQNNRRQKIHNTHVLAYYNNKKIVQIFFKYLI